MSIRRITRITCTQTTCGGQIAECKQCTKQYHKRIVHCGHVHQKLVSFADATDYPITLIGYKRHPYPSDKGRNSSEKDRKSSEKDRLFHKKVSCESSLHVKYGDETRHMTKCTICTKWMCAGCQRIHMRLKH